MPVVVIRGAAGPSVTGGPVLQGSTSGVPALGSTQHPCALKAPVTAKRALIRRDRMDTNAQRVSIEGAPRPTTTAIAKNGQGRAEVSDRFRPDIEGMRAVAVGLVVLYHGFHAPFTGGFVGVDVFFVISGFLITNLLLHEKARNGAYFHIAVLCSTGQTHSACRHACGAGDDVRHVLLAGIHRR